SPTPGPSLPSRIRRRRWASRCPCSRGSIALRRRLERFVRGVCTARLQARRRPGVAAPMPQARRGRGPRVPAGPCLPPLLDNSSEHRLARFIPRLCAMSLTCKGPLHYPSYDATMTPRPTVSGSAVRVLIDNFFGTSPLVVGSASFAVRNNGAQLVPATVQPLTFNGSASVIIPIGGSMYTDALAFEIDAWADVAVSVYLPG